MPKFRVVLDACVLVPYQLADLLLRLADAGLYEPLWSDEILAEVERAVVVKLEVPSVKASRRIGQMRSAFPTAAVSNYEDLIPAMTTDPKDRHVAAAAVRGGAALIVTANLRDFPPVALHPFDIEVVHPDDFLLDQLELDEPATVACLQGHRAAYSRPEFSSAEYYLGLQRTAPKFAPVAMRAEARLMGWRPEAPLPLEIVDDEAAAAAFFPDGEPAPTTPLGAAFIWWQALGNRTDFVTALQNLSLNSLVWGDYSAAAQLLVGHGMIESVDRCPDDENVAYVKFLPNVSRSMRSFGPVLLADAKILTMLMCADGLWRVWGLSPGRYPSAAKVRGDDGAR
ncbi:MAG: PIN domain-containing protein [Mycobacterium sp.]|nr:PIN domain-containing protein [Mycobacterium sp.]